MRRLVLLSTALCALAAPALAQTAIAPSPPQRFDTAPWWMAQPIIASLGRVTTEVRANRATFTAGFQAVEPTAERATQAAADKVRALTSALAAYGADKVRVETGFSITPLYDQYRDQAGNLVDNQRGDRIERYQVNANVSVEVRDVAVIERAFNTVAAAGPSSVGRVAFSLQPDNGLNTELFNAAVGDAARRARLAVEATGTRLGAVKLIDPTARACQTDVLVAGAQPGGENEAPQMVQLTGRSVSAMDAPPPPAPPPPPLMAPAARGGAGARPLDLQVTLQPPLVQRVDTACVIYALG